MKYWALLVVFLYFLILVVLTWPVGFLAFYKSSEIHIIEIFGAWRYWAVLGVMAISQAALLTVPVRVAGQRPLSRRNLLLPLAATGLMVGAMVLGACLSVHELVTKHIDLKDGLLKWYFLAGGVIWGLWTLIFYRLNRSEDPGMIPMQCRHLLKGSVLELLVAVPTHIVARGRDYCCAGVMTFFGLAMGISVMLFSFGPAVFFLFADRWKKLHPEKKADQGLAVQGRA